MSLKTLLKRIFTVAESNVLHGLDKLNDSEKRLKHTAITLSDKIRELETARLKNTKIANQMKKECANNVAEADRREDELKAAIARGATPNRAHVLIILHRRRIAEALEAKIKEVLSGEDKLNSGIIQLGDKLDDVKANLELVRVQKETNGLGLSLPDDIDYNIGLTTVDIDAMMREVEINDPGATAAAPSSIEVDNYLASLNK